jgi:protein-S-isoprenylcysteine O-methyltransferase Ste14
MPCPFTPPTFDKTKEVNYYWPSYYVSRFNFVLVHLFTVFYWFPFLFNNPLGFPIINTLDAAEILPPDQCTAFDVEAAKFDLGLFFGVWWLTHSGLSRRVVKQWLGLWEHPFDRPFFGLVACAAITIWTHFWQPVTNCEKWNVFATPLYQAALSSIVVAFCLYLILGFFWTMPDHVFGTSRHKVISNPPAPKLFTQFPYGMVRHPAATGFLWMFWSLPNWSANHIFYSACWSLFIVVGTSFEEGGLRSNLGDFGPIYDKYASQVGMFFPRLQWFRGESVRID